MSIPGVHIEETSLALVSHVQGVMKKTANIELARRQVVGIRRKVNCAPFKTHVRSPSGPRHDFVYPRQWLSEDAREEKAVAIGVGETVNLKRRPSNKLEFLFVDTM